MTDEEIRAAIQEFEDEAYHHSLHPEISEKSKAVALAALAQCDPGHKEYVERLEREVAVYRNAARLYGIDAKTMLTLARSQIKTCADNIRMSETLHKVLKCFTYVSDYLTEQEVSLAIIHYDGDGSKPFCDLVYCGLDIIRRYLDIRGDIDEWMQGDILES